MRLTVSTTLRVNNRACDGWDVKGLISSKSYGHIFERCTLYLDTGFQRAYTFSIQIYQLLGRGENGTLSISGNIEPTPRFFVRSYQDVRRISLFSLPGGTKGSTGCARFHRRGISRWERARTAQLSPFNEHRRIDRPRFAICRPSNRPGAAVRRALIKRSTEDALAIRRSR